MLAKLPFHSTCIDQQIDQNLTIFRSNSSPENVKFKWIQRHLNFIANDTKFKTTRIGNAGYVCRQTFFVCPKRWFVFSFVWKIKKRQFHALPRLFRTRNLSNWPLPAAQLFSVQETKLNLEKEKETETKDKKKKHNINVACVYNTYVHIYISIYI